MKTIWIAWLAVSIFLIGTWAVNAEAQVTLSSPAHGALITTNSVTFSWNKVGTDSTYTLEIAKGPFPTPPERIVLIKVIGLSYRSYGFDMDGGEYYWRVANASNPPFASYFWGEYRYFRCAISVPYVVDLHRRDAVTHLQESGLAAGGETEAYSEYIAANHVISQTPAASTVVNPGTAINLVISKGPEPRVTVPDVRGLLVSEAETVLTSQNLVLGSVTEEYHSIVNAGEVIRQVPPPSTSVDPNSSVSLIVSKGPAPTAVEGESEQPDEGEPTEGEDEPAEGEGEPIAEGEYVEGETFVEGEIEGEDEESSGCGCPGSKGGFPHKDRLGDWLLVGLVLVALMWFRA